VNKLVVVFPSGLEFPPQELDEAASPDGPRITGVSHLEVAKVGGL
jgi:hypothetical protein